MYYKYLWSVVGLVWSPPPPAPRPVDCKAYQLLPFSSADSLVIIGDISAFCTPWLIPLCPHPPLSNHLRGSSTFSQMKEERSSREGETKANFAKDPLCKGNALPVGKSGAPPGTEPHLSFLLSRTCGALQSCTSTSTWTCTGSISHTSTKTQY